MIQKVFVNYQPMILDVMVTAQGTQSIRIIVRDSDQENTTLADRVVEFNGEYHFYVRLPLCRKYVDIVLYNEEDKSNTGFIYNGFKKMPLLKRMDAVDFTRYNLTEYIKFIEKFCYNAGALRTNDPNNSQDYYVSKNWHFFIKYLPIIVDYENGQEVPTPCRISSDTGLIEVSQKYFVNETVPGRVTLLLHEFAHPYINSNPDNEKYADHNGMLIYLGLGYPRVEGAITWSKTFMENDTEENASRMEYIMQLFSDFDNKKLVFNYK